MTIFSSDLYLGLISIVAIVISTISIYNVYKIKTRLAFLKDIDSATDLDEKVLLILKKVDEALNTNDIIRGRLRKMEQKLNSSLVKKVLKRYNPFHDTGSNQSFSLCLLDSNYNGVLISALYSRGQTNLYAKEIVEGKPISNLSEEENEILQQALND